LSPIDWNFIKQRPQHLAYELSRRHRVVYFYPQTMTKYLRRWLTREKGETASASFTRTINERLTLYQPLMLPQRSNVILSRLNKNISRMWLQRLIKKEKLRDFILWINHPHQAGYTSLFPDQLVIYDCMDNWADFNLGRERELIEREERYILSKADAVFASSQLLYDRIKQKREQAYLIPNAAEVEHFAQAVNVELTMPADLKNLKKPLIGYVGTVAEWHDMELISFAAKTRADFEFVFIGPIGENADIGECGELSNIHFLGGKPYEMLPSYLQHVDVCILPFRTGDFAASIDPVKAYEYLAAGKPVVATDMPELRKFGRMIKIAGDESHFVKLLDESLGEIKSGRHNPFTVSGMMKDHSWESRAGEIEDVLSRYGRKAQQAAGSLAK
jgi:glycosyltransferase involved in cell wall biosynthesis